ncbi:hypothetical protein ILYODFUR_015023 [Ilyodon furcidens]|uniref:Uncharacterized protein n=1 Tax=Ilyodon furcidens TaxID=33524 RepID=A0ABV0TUS5_9TELE
MTPISARSILKPSLQPCCSLKLSASNLKMNLVKNFSHLCKATVTLYGEIQLDILSLLGFFLDSFCGTCGLYFVIFSRRKFVEDRGKTCSPDCRGRDSNHGIATPRAEGSLYMGRTHSPCTSAMRRISLF